MLREVVVSGTGKAAQLNGYTSAGKTGTAWKFDEKLKRVNSAKYISSFIGFAPAENPENTIAVVIDEPKVGGRNGGQVAGPVFREIAEQILPEMNVKPDLNVEQLAEVVEEIPETVGNGTGGPDASLIGESLAEESPSNSIFPISPKGRDSKALPSVAKIDNTGRVEKYVTPIKDGKPKAGPSKLPVEVKPEGLIKNKSSTQKKREKT